METLNTVLLWVATVGQALFVILWATRPFWVEWIGRALMVKSLALGTFLLFALVRHYTNPRPGGGSDGWSTALFGFVVLGILTQLFALIREMWRTRDRAEP